MGFMIETLYTFRAKTVLLGQYRGAAKSDLASQWDSRPDLTVTITNQVVTDDQVVNECVWRGTHTGPLQSPAGEIPPTGKPVTGGRFCEVWEIQGGQIARLRNYQDVSTWLRQLGLVP